MKSMHLNFKQLVSLINLLEYKEDHDDDDELVDKEGWTEKPHFKVSLKPITEVLLPAQK